MENKPLVSIIIPTYNTATYLKEAVDSALAQTYENKEVIIVDDGSTDNTKSILDPYTKAKKVRYIYQDNQGLSRARNTGIKAAGGKYVAFLDADDIFLNNKLEKQVQHLEGNLNIDISYCDLYHFFDGEPNKLYKLNYQYYSGDQVFKNLLKQHFIAPLTLVIRRSLFDQIGYFDIKLKRSEDLEFLLRASYKSSRIEFLPEVLAKLRVRRTQNLQGVESQPEMKEANLKLLQDLKEKLTTEEWKQYKLDSLLKKYHLKLALAYLMNYKKAEARQYCFSAGFLGILLKIAIQLLPISFLAKTTLSQFQKRQKTNYIPV